MKKGELSVSKIVPAIVAVVVLLVVLSSTGNLFGKQINFFKLLPGFDKDNKTVENIEIFRYDILTRGVMYFDGTNWNEFEGEFRAGDKKVNYDKIRKDFENWYYFTKRGGVFEIEQGVSLISFLNLVNGYNSNIVKIDKNLEDQSKLLGALNFNIYEFYVPNEIATGYDKNTDFIFEKVGNTLCEDCKIGDVRFQIMNKDLSKGSFISFILSLDNSVSILNSDNKQSSKIMIKGDLLTRMFNFMKNWRDGVFSKPIGINYRVDDYEVFQYFCGKLTNSRYVVIDLSNGVDSDAKC